MHPFARTLSSVSSVSQETCLSLVSSLSLAVCHNTRRPSAPQVSARAVGLAQAADVASKRREVRGAAADEGGS